MEFMSPEDVHGQRRTSKSKKFVIFRKDEPGLVYKGPYLRTEQRYKNIVNRSNVLRTLDVKHVILPLGEREVGGKIWIGFPNLLGHFPSSSISNKESWVGGLSYNITTDDGLYKLSKVLPGRSEERPCRERV